MFLKLKHKYNMWIVWQFYLQTQENASKLYLSLSLGQEDTFRMLSMCFQPRKADQCLFKALNVHDIHLERCILKVQKIYSKDYNPS